MVEKLVVAVVLALIMGGALAAALGLGWLACQDDADEDAEDSPNSQARPGS